MITEALSHFTGIGPVRLAQLHAAGLRSWMDICDQPSRIPESVRPSLLNEAQQSLAALERDDVDFLVNVFSPQDRWRILAAYFDRTSFFDIETSGLEIDAAVTVIVCWHQGELHTFVEHENLDEFLDLLDDVTLLASFNGASFDVPRVLDAFHIPQLPCPHLDLRWTCYHAGLNGSLKNIAAELQIDRPQDIADTDGAVAVQLWSEWQERQDAAARQHLIRYCSADVVMLTLLAQHLADVQHYDASELWSQLPKSIGEPRHTAPSVSSSSLVANLFGKASPSRLRTRRPRTTG